MGCGGVEINMGGRRLLAVAGVLAVVALAGCGDQPPSEGSSPSAPTKTTSPVPLPSPSSTEGDPSGALVGVAEEGVEAGCWLLDGFLLLGGNEDLISSGREIRVTGQVQKDVATTCQQGIPYRVETVEPAS